MSRSYKKSPVCMDTSKFYKKFYNRKFRRSYLEMPTKSNNYRKAGCSYDIKHGWCGYGVSKMNSVNDSLYDKELWKGRRRYSLKHYQRFYKTKEQLENEWEKYYRRK